MHGNITTNSIIPSLCSPASRIPQVDPKETKEGGIHQVVPEVTAMVQHISERVRMDMFVVCLMCTWYILHTFDWKSKDNGNHVFIYIYHHMIQYTYYVCFIPYIYNKLYVIHHIYHCLPCHLSSWLEPLKRCQKPGSVIMKLFQGARWDATAGDLPPASMKGAQWRNGCRPYIWKLMIQTSSDQDLQTPSNRF